MDENPLIPGLQDYLINLLPERNPIFDEIESYAKNIDFPAIGPLIGHYLQHYALLIGAKRILELGSGFGYSALWFANGMPNDSEIILTDFTEENKKLALTYLERAGILNRINVKFYVGDALDILSNIEGDFDIIFNDIDKEEYPQAFKASVPRLRKGGLLITDNSLWYGKIIEPTPDEATLGVQKYNRLAFEDTRVLSVMIPVRDGLCVSIRL